MTRSGRANGRGRSDGHRTGAGLRCAIYTRKSSEEGLEQGFNSLHAQREACEAYVLSQKHEGWTVLPSHYDDGGFSGGTIERPAIERLLQDVEAGRIDVVVVYKVDRLTRSLADFAKIVEIFDANGVSFVSVTQQFNTTSSMGRLTLNVLLSFAQFEREVTGERIRDKIAASKKKGMWMGGFVPLGYEPKDRSLIINENEAETVKALFDLYRRRGNVRLVKEEADRLGLKSKQHRRSNGRTHGGVSFSRGAIYKILSNPIYVGEIAHKGERHAGTHAAIVDRQTWDEVQRRLSDNAVRQKHQTNAQSPSLLAGLIFDEAGEPLTPSHASKQDRRYRYYVSRSLLQDGRSSAERAGGSPASSSWRLPAAEVEGVVAQALSQLLRDSGRLMDQLGLSHLDPRALDQILFSAGQFANEIEHAWDSVKRATLTDFIDRVEIASEAVIIRINVSRLLNRVADGKGRTTEGPLVAEAPFDLRIPMKLRRRGSELKLIVTDREPAPNSDRSLMSNLARGFSWAEELRTGLVKSLGAIADRENLSRNFIRRCCDLAFLPTDLIEAIAAGQQPLEINSESFKTSYPLPVSWGEQKRLLADAPSASIPLTGKNGG